MVFVTNPQAAQIAPLNLLRKTANMNAPVRFRQPVGKALSPSHLNTPLRVAQMVPRPPAVSLHGRYSAGTRAVMHSLCALFIWFAIPQLLKAQGGTVTVVAGLPGQYGYSGDGAAATNALMDSPVAAVVASDGTVYIADYYNAVVRKIDPKNGFISTFAGGGGCSPNSNGYCGAGGMADNAVLSAPVSLALDAQGSLYIADQGAGVIFKVSTLLGVSTITSIVGQGDNSCYPASASDSCPAGTSGLGVINGIAIDPVRSLLYLSNDEGQILKVNLAANVVSLEAGVYEAYAYDGDNGPAVDAKLNIPEQVALDSAGSLYFADTSNNVIRKITLGGVITTVAGTGTASFDGDGGKGTLAKLNTPFGVAVDPSGNLYIADTGNARIRMVDAVTGTIGTIAGSSAVGCVLQKDALGDGCSPLLTNMAHISSLAVDSANYIYLAGRYDFGSGLPDPTLGNDETVRKLPVVTATPTFIPAAGYYLDPPYVQITDSTINASIYYTLDGTTPTTSSAKFDPNYPIAVPFGATTIQAIAVAPGYSPSLVNIAAYVTGVPAPPAPTFAPTPGAYIGAQTITLTDANVSAAIYFTTDGTTPTTSSNHYITGFILSTSQTVKAIAVLSGYAKSAVTTGTYTINYPIVAPSVSVMPGSSSITTLQSLTVTVTVGGAPGYPAPTGSVTVTCGTYSSLSAVISSGSAVITIPSGSLTVGNETLSASFTPDGGSSAFYSGATGSNAVKVSLAAPTITFSVLDQVYPTAQFTLGATSTSTGGFTYTVTNGPATISGATVTLTGTGQVTVLATEIATGIYGAGSQSATFNVTSSPSPTITFAVPNHTFGDAAFHISATSNSSGAITFSKVSGPATVSGSTVSLTGAGTVVLQAMEAASVPYTSGSQNATFVVAAGTPAVTWTPATHVLYTGLPLSSGVLNASASVTGSFAYTAALQGGSTVSVTPSSVPAAGSYTLTANFTPTDSVDYTTGSATQTISILIEHVWAVNSNGSVSSLDAAGNAFNSTPGTGGQFGIAIDNSGNIWSVNATGASLSEFSKAGGIVSSSVSGGGLSSANSLAIDGAGLIWVVNGNNSVSVFSNSGTAISPPGGYTGGGLSNPNAITIDNSGSVWITNLGSNTVTRILGGAAPVAPIATGVTNGTTGAKP